MIIQGIGLDNGGQLRYTKFTVNFADMNALGAVVSGDIPLFTIPQGGKFLAAMVKHSAQFAGVAGTLKVSIGKTGTAAFFTAATADLVATAVADGTLQETPGLFKSGQLSALPVVMNCVSGTGNINLLTAGSVDAYILWTPVSTPNV